MGFKLSYIWLAIGLATVAIGAQAYIIRTAWKGGANNEIVKTQAIAIETIQNVGKAETRGEVELKKAPSVDAALKNKGWCDDCSGLLSFPKRPDVSGPQPAWDLPGAVVTPPTHVAPTAPPAVADPEAPAKVKKPKKAKAAKQMDPPKTALCESIGLCLAATDQPARPRK